MTPTAYERHKNINRDSMAATSRRGRNIGTIPWVAQPQRRMATARDFRLFCETYFPLTFPLAWCDDHLIVIRQIEESVLHGGLFATAMPRGSGKTSLCEVACMWAKLNGHRDFVSLIGSDEGKSTGMLDSIKTELESNDLLAGDFPEACLPISKLEGIANRCSGQLYNDRRTHIEWTAKEIVLPTLAPEGWLKRKDHRPFVHANGLSLSSGAIVRVGGITGGIRGMKFKRPDGQTVRPSLAVIDDPQTDGSARSPSQCETRERILSGAILGLAGPGKKIAAIMPCTVICPGDMADNILSHEKHPEWNGTRTKMVYSFPTNEKLWDEYKQVRDEGFKSKDGGKAGTAFYAANRAAMDEGARVAWPERFEPGELSAIQYAMNIKLYNPRAFYAEYQNEPLPENDINPDDLTADQVAAKINRMPRGAVPSNATRLTAMIDVHGTVHYYCVVAYDDNFTGHIIDYGTYPDQKRPYFTLRDAKVTFKQTTKATSQEGQIYAGLEATTDLLFSREWKRDDGAVLTIERCLIDSNWGPHTGLVLKFCRESKWAAAITPSRGRGVGVSSLPMSEYTKRPGDRVGLNWHLSVVKEHRSLRRVEFDSNFWKSFVHTRFAVAMGDKSCLSIFGDKPEQHRLFAEHITAEHRVVTKREGSSRTVDEWKWNINRPDNHWLDCLVGACVAASMQGVALAESSVAPGDKPKRVSFAELQRRRRA